VVYYVGVGGGGGGVRDGGEAGDVFARGTHCCSGWPLGLYFLSTFHKVQYYAGCDPFMGLSYFNYGRKPALFSSSQIFFYGDIAAGH
jgi:hypothetical protein